MISKPFFSFAKGTLFSQRDGQVDDFPVLNGTCESLHQTAQYDLGNGCYFCQSTPEWKKAEMSSYLAQFFSLKNDSIPKQFQSMTARLLSTTEQIPWLLLRNAEEMLTHTFPIHNPMTAHFRLFATYSRSKSASLTDDWITCDQRILHWFHAIHRKKTSLMQNVAEFWWFNHTS